MADKKSKPKEKASKPDDKAPKAKKVILAVAIAIILALFIGYGIHTFYKSPKYEDFCRRLFPEKLPPYESKEIANCADRERYNSQFENDCYESSGTPRYDYDDNGCRLFKECDYCNKKFDDARERYNKDVFIVAVVLGLVAILAGGVALKLESVSSGVMAGGILTVIYGTLRYWGEMQDILRWITLGVVLAVLIAVGYKKFRK